MKDTKIINLIAAPCCGKSTLASHLFAKMKYKGLDVELISEYHKELVYEERYETFKDELYTFAKQNHRLFRVNGKVDWIVTDRPIILSTIYGKKYGDYKKSFVDIVLDEHSRYKNINILLERDGFSYDNNGRNQGEEENLEIGKEIKEMLKEFNIDYKLFKSNEKTIDKIMDYIAKEGGF